MHSTDICHAHILSTWRIKSGLTYAMPAGSIGSAISASPSQTSCLSSHPLHLLPNQETESKSSLHMAYTTHLFQLLLVTNSNPFPPLFAIVRPRHDAEKPLSQVLPTGQELEYRLGCALRIPLGRIRAISRGEDSIATCDTTTKSLSMECQSDAVGWPKRYMQSAYASLIRLYTALPSRNVVRCQIWESAYGEMSMQLAYALRFFRNSCK